MKLKITLTVAALVLGVILAPLPCGCVSVPVRRVRLERGGVITAARFGIIKSIRKIIYEHL